MIEVKELCLKAILKSVSCRVNKGKITLFLGKSGSGKSTLLRALAGIEKEYVGKVLVEGRSLPHLKPKERAKKVGFICQGYSLFPHQNVLLACMQPLMLTLKLPKEEARERSLTLLKKMDMANYQDRLPHELSGGQRQRVCIIRTLALNPDFLLFDEPTSALDRGNSDLFVEILLALKKEGKGIAIATHDLELAQKVGDSRYILEGGVIRHLA